MNFYLTVVANETEFAELVHEKAHPRSCRTDHFSQSFLTNGWINGRGSTFLAKIRQQEEKACETLSLELNSWSIKSSSTRLFVVNR
jgi:hypothetical protein